MNNDIIVNKKRGRIKNIAIIFLSVMLVLTFFSNTFLNWSLPEVSGKYAGYGQIKTAVTGSGTVKANMNYNVVTEQTRKIDAVHVKAGDTVEAGQLLFTFEEYTAPELEQAIETLNDMEFNYKLKVLQHSSPDYAETELNLEKLRKDLEDAKVEKAEAERYYLLIKGSEELAKIYQTEKDKYTQSVSDIEEEISELTQKEAAGSAEIASKLEEIETLKTNIKAAEQALERREQEYTEISESIDTSYSAAQSAVESAESTYESAYNELVYLKRDYSDLLAAADSYKKLESNVSTTKAALSIAKTSEASAKNIYDEAKKTAYGVYSGNIDSDEEYNALLGAPSSPENDAIIKALTEYRDAKKAYGDAVSATSSAQSAYDKAESELKAASLVTDPAIAAAKKQVERQQGVVDNASKALSKARGELSVAATNQSRLDDAKEAKERAQKNLNTLNNNLDSLEMELDKLLSAKTKAAKAKLKSENQKLKAVGEKLDSENKKLSELKNKMPNTPEQLSETVIDLERQIKTAEAAYDKKLGDDSIANQVYLLEIERDLAAIEKQKEKVAELSEQTFENEITAKNRGVIASVNFFAGETVNAGETLAEIELEGKGYTLEIPVTAEQSRQIRIGDRVTINNYYWGNQIELSVAAIKNDRTNPGQQKIIEIDVMGDVNNGQTLDVSIGERSTSYDLVVPNSAIREDSEGKFILVASVKNTPLGNRYIAKRVNVTVLAKDTINTAVDAGTDYGYEYVISGSTAPISDGTQVRLADGS